MSPPPAIPAIAFIGGFESTYQPAYDVDVAERSGHIRRWRSDLDSLRAHGVSRVRYPIRWHRIEAEPGVFHWAATDEVLGHLRDTGMHLSADLLHFTSYPRWLKRGFADPAFPEAYLRYVEAFARRYPWVEEYTLCNEPLTAFLLCGQEGKWPPHLTDLQGFVTLARSVMPAIAEASRRLRDLLPGARHVWLDTCEAHRAVSPKAQRWTDFVSDRRFFLLDVFLGRDDATDRSRPFVKALVKAGGRPLLDLVPGRVDVLGLDYYAHHQWDWFDRYGHGSSPSRQPAPLATVIGEYWQRYRLPCILGETNIRGFASDRATWLKYTLEQCERAVAAGVALEGYCWFPFTDSCDWDSLLTRSWGHLDPVGVLWLDKEWEPQRSCMSDAYSAAAHGAAAADLPAYRLRPPVSDQLAGFLAHMAHWDWQEPPH